MKKTKINILNLFLFLSIIFILIIYALNNIHDSNLWYDEAVQFYLSKGLSWAVPPFTPFQNNLVDIIKMNAMHNFDPGGFTILFSIFSRWNYSIEWLRLFPYLFFILSVFGLIGITKELSGSLRLGLLSGLLFFVLPASKMLLNFAFELRAYSMEACGIFVCFYLLLKTYKNPDQRNLLILGLVSLFFIGSRYSFWIYSAILSAALFIYVFNKSVKNFITKGYFYYLPVLSGFLFYTFYSLIPQHFIQKFAYHYSDYSILGYQDFLTKIVFFLVNFLSVKALPIFIFIVGFAILKIRGYGRKNPDKSPDISHFNMLFFIVILYELIFIVLSFLKIYPWLIYARWSIGLNALSLICATAILSISYLFIKNRFFVFYKKIKDNNFIGILLIIILFSLSFEKLKDRKIPVKDTLLSSILSLEKKDTNFYNYTYLVPVYSLPVVKYQFEYGKLSGKKYRKIYPNNFIFDVPIFKDQFTFLSHIPIPINKLKKVDVILLSLFHMKRRIQIVNNISKITSNKFKMIDKNIAIKVKTPENVKN